MDILFDLDGTLIDPKVGITRSIQYALEAMNVTACQEDDFTWCIGPPLLDSFTEILGNSEDAEVALAKYRERFAQEGLFENEVYAGVPEMLAELTAKGHRLYLATSKPRVFAQKIMDIFDLSKYFTCIHGSELDGERGDKVALLTWIIEQEQLNAHNVIMIGDRKFDMIGAKGNNVRSVGVLYGYGGRSELENACADVIIATVSELREHLRSIAPQSIKDGHDIVR